MTCIYTGPEIRTSSPRNGEGWNEKLGFCPFQTQSATYPSYWSVGSSRINGIIRISRLFFNSSNPRTEIIPHKRWELASRGLEMFANPSARLQLPRRAAHVSVKGTEFSVVQMKRVCKDAGMFHELHL